MSINFTITNIIPFVKDIETQKDVLTKIRFTYLAEHETGVAASVTKDIILDISGSIPDFKEFSEFTQSDVNEIIEKYIAENKVNWELEAKIDRLLYEPKAASFSFQIADEGSPELVLDKAPDYVLSQNEKECIEIFEALKPLCKKPIDSTFVMSLHAQMKKNGKSLDEIKSFVLEHYENLPEPGLYLSMAVGQPQEDLIGAIEDGSVPADVALVNPDPNAENYYAV